MASATSSDNLEAMNTFRVVGALLLGCILPLPLHAQYLFRVTFRGTVYTTNGNGQVVSSTFTEKDLLQAFAGNLDPNSLALAYHIQGSSYGDTLDVVDGTTGYAYNTVFGLFFGDDTIPGYPLLYRTALTNSVNTQVRRMDTIFMSTSTAYTTPNPGGHSMGSCFTAKRFMFDASGHMHTTIDGQIQWQVNPYNGAGTKVCMGSFTTTKPFP